MGTFAVQQSTEQMPDFRTEVLNEEAEIDEKLKDIDAFLDAVVVPVGTPQEEIDRLTEEKKALRRKEKIQKREETIKKREHDFVYEKEERFQEGVQFILWGLFLCLFGALLLRLRHPFSK